MTTSTPKPGLTDRYVWAVLRALPSGQRPELEPEIRALVADAIEARTAAGDSSPAEAERAALTELGDPGALAGRYTNRAQVLIGPALYPEWWRLLTVLLPILIPIIAIVVTSAELLGGSTVGEAIVSGGFASFGVALQTMFWVTLVFAIIERTTGTTGMPASSWSLDDLPDLPDDGRMGVVEFAASLIFNLFVFAALLWVQLQPPIVIDGEAFPLFDPALWSFWLPWFLVVLAAEMLFTIALYIRGRWTYPFAVINALLGAAFAIPVLYLWQNDLLLNPALVAQITASTGSDWLAVSGLITAIVLVVVVAWDAIEGFLKAWRASKAVAAAA